MNDLKDIITATIGTGLGFGAHAGPVNIGLGYVGDSYGIRSGSFGENQVGHFRSGYNVHFVVLGEEANWHDDDNPDWRKKRYRAGCTVVTLPMFFECPEEKG